MVTTVQPPVRGVEPEPPLVTGPGRFLLALVVAGSLLGFTAAAVVAWWAVVRDPSPAAVITTAPLPDDTAAPDPTPSVPQAATPEEALVIALEADDVDWLGPCPAATTEDLGRVCWGLHSAAPTAAVYGIGTPFSEYYQWVLVEETSAGWLVTSTAAVDVFPEPPWDPAG